MVHTQCLLLFFLNHFFSFFLDISIFHRYLIPNSILVHFNLNTKKTTYPVYPTPIGQIWQTNILLRVTSQCIGYTYQSLVINLNYILYWYILFVDLNNYYSFKLRTLLAQQFVSLIGTSKIVTIHQLLGALIFTSSINLVTFVACHFSEVSLWIGWVFSRYMMSLSDARKWYNYHFTSKLLKEICK